MRISSILAGLTVLGALSACSLPSPMPVGYTYHHDTYKTPPGPKAGYIGYEYSAPANAFVMGMWQDVAAKLVDNLEGAYGLMPQDIFVKTPFLKGAQIQSLDYALREVLAGEGYTVVPRDPSITTLSFEIKDLPPEQMEQYQANLTPQDQVGPGEQNDFGPKLIVLHLTQPGTGERILQETHVVPNFGYVPDHGGKPLVDLNPVFGRSPDEIYTPANLRPEPYNE